MPMNRASMTKQVSQGPMKKTVKPVKMQKGGMVPCKGCKNPAACKKAGQCLAKA
jgi:hypothetical protein